MTEALALAARGLPIFPVWNMRPDHTCACGAPHLEGKGAPGKHPITPRGLNDATTDAEQIRKWWAIAPDASIGISVPNGMVIVDVDPRNQGEETFESLEAQHGKFPPTRTVRTGGDGVHLYYWAAGAYPSTLGPGIDIKQLGGFVVAPPSNHASGGSYSWVSAPDAPIADAPAWLLARSLGPRGERVTVVIEDDDERAVSDADVERVVAVLEPHYSDGSKHNFAKAFGGWARQHGWNPSDVRHAVELLPSKDPRARVKVALAAFGIEKAFGRDALQQLIGSPNLEALEAITPNQEREQLTAFAAAMGARAVEYQPPVVALAPPAANANAVPANDWASWAAEIDLSREPPAMPWLIRDLQIGPGRPTAIMAFANGAKTPLALALATAIASGKPVLGMSVVPGRVAYFCYEAARITHGKVLRIARGLDAGIENLTLFRMTKLLTEPGALEALLGVVRQRAYTAVFVDTYGSAIANIDHNSADFALVLRLLERVSDETGATFVVLVHSKKDQTGELSDLSGHNAAAGAVQVVLGLSRPDLSDKTLIEVTCVRELDRAFAPFRVRFVDAAGDALQLVRVGALPVAPDVKAAALVEPLVELIRQNGGLRGISKEAIEALGKERAWPRDTVRAALGIAEGAELIFTTGAGLGRAGKAYKAHDRGSPTTATAYAPPGPKPRVPPPDPPMSEIFEATGAAIRAANDGSAE